MKPLIGITCNFDTGDQIGVMTDMGVRGQSWDYVANHYSRSVERAGGIPVLIPIYEDFTAVKELLRRLDGVILTGGHDISPLRYGEPVRHCGRIETKRDEQDFKIAGEALERGGLPLLGICRGCQIINVYYRGTMYQELTEAGFQEHSCENAPLSQSVHCVNLTPGSRLQQIFGTEKLGVNSYHHQGIREVGRGLAVSAVSDDGVTEGIELPGSAFVVGVQWHPEMMVRSQEHQALFRALVRAAKNGNRP